MKFKNIVFQSSYKDNGYLIVPLLSESHLEKLDDIVNKYYPDLNESGFSLSNQKLDEVTNKLMNAEINDIISGEIARFIENAEIFFSVLVSKLNTPDSKLNIHTDRSIIDEMKNMPVNVWIPLCDVSEQNGTLSVFEGSHHFTHSYRGLNTRQYYLEGEYYDFIEQNCMKYLNVKRGEAVFYHAGMIHGSAVNNSTKVRNAILVSMHPEKVDIVYEYQRQKFNFFNQVEIYKANIDYWLPNPETDPKGKLPLLYKRRNTKPKIRIDDLKKMILKG